MSLRPRGEFEYRRRTSASSNAANVGPSSPSCFERQPSWISRFATSQSSRDTPAILYRCPRESSLNSRRAPVPSLTQRSTQFDAFSDRPRRECQYRIIPGNRRIEPYWVPRRLAAPPRAGSRCPEHVRQSNRSRHYALYSTRAWQRPSAPRAPRRVWRNTATGARAHVVPLAARKRHSTLPSGYPLDGPVVALAIRLDRRNAGLGGCARHRVDVTMRGPRTLGIVVRDGDDIDRAVKGIVGTNWLD